MCGRVYQDFGLGLWMVLKDMFKIGRREVEGGED